ncbi:MAG: gfo/Idh/MocA family oxidoreductase, partial [Betaproteobacteria bacterium]|nr:gfo/Idh/MocA family oxidoreductase [Betaproteobacteria bacterium]
MKVFGVGIIGCGLIGQKRAKALGSGGKLVACADIEVNRAENLARTSAAKVFRDWRELVWSPEVEVLVVATLHDSLAEITRTAAEAGKHVLVEKPAARNAAELEPVILAAAKHGVKVHVGFNHRYHRSLRKAKEIVDSGALGELMFVRARYGHGARIGY